MRVYFFQSEVDFAEVTREKVKFAERYIMEAKKAWVVNKIEVKRASNATRELNVNTLRWSV